MKYIIKITPKSYAYFLFLILLYVVFHMWFASHLLNLVDEVSSIFFIKNRLGEVPSTDLKHILLWTKYTYDIIVRKGKIVTPILNCPINSCVITEDKEYFGSDYTRFDAILFNDRILASKNLPAKRVPSQVYVFNTLESSYTVPACEVHNDGFFNWTLTYRLDSDIVWSYFIVRNRKGTVVAPSTTVKWRRSIRPIKQNIKTILAGKKKTAAWLVSHCEADSLRDEYLTKLQEHLFHFALRIDVYGGCTRVKCPGNNCDRMIKNNYYFYMAFENSFSEDYVTEKVLHGYNNYAVPIVYGGANYSRFLPSGSYINAREMHPYNLAFAMYQAINTPTLLETYFKWTNLYTVNGDFRDSHPLCKLCSKLHQNRPAPVKKKFRLWWNGLNGFKWCLSDTYWNESANVNVDAKHIFHMY